MGGYSDCSGSGSSANYYRVPSPSDAVGSGEDPWSGGTDICASAPGRGPGG